MNSDADIVLNVLSAASLPVFTALPSPLKKAPAPAPCKKELIISSTPPCHELTELAIPKWKAPAAISFGIALCKNLPAVVVADTLFLIALLYIGPIALDAAICALFAIAIGTEVPFKALTAFPAFVNPINLRGAPIAGVKPTNPAKCPTLRAIASASFSGGSSTFKVVSPSQNPLAACPITDVTLF